MRGSERPTAADEPRWLTYGAVSVFLLSFVAIRLPLLTDYGVIRGWNSDAAIYALMGKRMFEGRGFDIFFWGQNYMGPLTSIVAALWGAVLSLAGLADTVDPRAARLATITNVAVGSLFFSRALALRDRRLGWWTAGLLLTGQAFVFHFSLIPNGPDMVFLIGSILFYLAALQLAGEERWKPFRTWRGRFLFGTVAGIGWWMNQGEVFFLLAISVVFILRSEWYRSLYSALRPADRLMLRTERLCWRLEPHTRQLLLALQAILLADIGWYVLSSVTPIGYHELWLYSPLLERLGMLLGLQLLLALFQRDQTIRATSGAISASLPAAPAAFPLIGGILLGYSPVWLGRLLNWYEPAYSFGVPLNPLSSLLTIPPNFVRTTLPHLLGAHGTVGIAYLTILSIAAALLISRDRKEVSGLLLLRPGRYGIVVLVALVIVINIAYFTFIGGGLDGIRYLAAAAPAVVALIAVALVRLMEGDRLEQGLGLLLTLLMIASMASGAAAVASTIRAEEDPRIVIERIEAEGYTICYANFWLAYKYEFLSGERIRFIPYESQNRTRAESNLRRLERGPKCLLEQDGTVRPYTEAMARDDEATRQARRDRPARRNAGTP
jgi:hypothetical protein